VFTGAKYAPMERLRIDKWLWAARFYKTRSLASDELVKGRVQVNEQVAKPAREIKVGDTLEIRQGPVTRTVIVLGISAQRGAAPIAQQLYDETPASRQKREQAAEARRLGSEPAQAIEHGRPTKRDRRSIEKAWNTSLDA
jgi:ribosome-associated heat shock protein Hsp15